MRILSLASKKTGCWKVRNKLPLDQLEARHQVSYASQKTPQKLSGWDIVIFSNIMGGTVIVNNGKEREVPMETMVKDYRALGARIVYDTDDAQEIHPYKNDKETEDRKKASKLIEENLHNYFYLLKEADLITCTTEKLKKHLSQFTDKPIRVLPNSINPEDFIESGKSDKVKIVYAGSDSHIVDAELVTEPLYNLRKKYDLYIETFGFQIGFRDWKSKKKGNVSIDKYYEALSGMNADIGVCPLLENEFNLNKSPLKFLEYATAGIMALASNRLPYSLDMKPEWLVDDDKWEETLDKFINDPELVKKTLKDQQDWILENRDIRKTAKLWEEAYTELLDGGLTEDKGLVSVIIPAYNYAHYLVETLMSVFTQTYQNVEIIVVDDGSEDHTRELCEGVIDPRFKYIHQENKGLSGARNTGLKASKGDWILNLDADDTIPPNFIEEMMKKTEKGVGLISSHYNEFGDRDNIVRMPDVVDLKMLLEGNQCCSCSLFSKEAVDEVGGFDELMKDGYEDWEMWIRILSKFKFNRADVAFNYRIHGDSMINGTIQKHDKIVKYIKNKHSKLYEKMD